MTLCLGSPFVGMMLSKPKGNFILSEPETKLHTSSFSNGIVSKNFLQKFLVCKGRSEAMLCRCNTLHYKDPIVLDINS
jgi:hypothetical protein